MSFRPSGASEEILEILERLPVGIGFGGLFNTRCLTTRQICEQVKACHLLDVINAAICSSDNPVYLEISLGSTLSFNIARATSSLPLSFAKAIWFRMSRSVVMSFRYLILSSGAKLCKSAEENNRSKISPSNPAGLPCYDCCLLVFCCAGKQRKAPGMRFGRTVGNRQTASGDGAPK